MHGHIGGSITDDHIAGSNVADHSEPIITPTGAPGSRTRRSGLLTVMERPPGTIFIDFLILCL